MVIASSEVYPEFSRIRALFHHGPKRRPPDRHARLSRSAGEVGRRAGHCLRSDHQPERRRPDVDRHGPPDFPIRTAPCPGPAAGATGAAFRARLAGFPEIVTLDVGGTSADVSILTGGRLPAVHSRNLAGFPLRLPALDVNSVGAGGGSIAWIDRDGLLKVGPQSAGAVPGPACYARGGKEATVTDAQVMLGRLAGDALLDGRMPIRRVLAAEAIESLSRRIHLPPVETALGIVRLVCANIVRAIRSISVERGHDPAAFALFVFGGAGPLHAAETARELGIKRIVVPPHPGILCAEGLLNSDLATDLVRTVGLVVDSGAGPALERIRDGLRAEADAWFAREKIAPAARRFHWSADLRYRGQNFELPVGLDPKPLRAPGCRALIRRFHAEHDRAYGFAQSGETIELINMRLKLIALLDKPALTELAGRRRAKPVGARRVCFAADDWRQAPVFRRSELGLGQRIKGPAILEQMDSTTPLFPGDVCRVDRWGNLIIDLAPEKQP